MALDDFDEHEQGERVRQWLRQYGGVVVLGLAGGIAALAGWQYLQTRERAHAAEAQTEYQGLLDARTRSDSAAVEAAVTKLRAEFSDTAYGAFAALVQARDALDKSDYAAAEAALEWAGSSTLDPPALAALIELRLAQVRFAKVDAQGALDALARVTAGLYKAPVAELRGDALSALGRVDDARAAYDEALAAMESGSPQRDFVSMKRDDLGTPAAASAGAAKAAS